MNKKILAILMALLMVLMGSVAFAVTEAGVSATIPLKKVYTTTTEGLYPTETVTFAYELVDLSATADGSTNATAYAGGPLSGTWTEELSGSKNWTETLGEFTKVGKYTYKITETAGTAAGVTYGTDEIYAQVLVSYDENQKLTTQVGIVLGDGADSKNDIINNSFAEADLTVTKEITGNMADLSKTFEIVVTLKSTAPVYNTITVTDAGQLDSDASDTATIAGGWTGEKVVKLTVGNGSNFVISGIPVDADAPVTYTVVETSPAPYTATGEVKTATEFSADATVAVVNNYDSTVDTGVTTDSMPYIMLMAFVMMLAAAVVLKKRTVND